MNFNLVYCIFTYFVLISVICLMWQIDGDLMTTIKFVDALKIPYIAPSFGGCESIVDQPAIMSYWYVVLLILLEYLDFVFCHYFTDCLCESALEANRIPLCNGILLTKMRHSTFRQKIRG